MTFKMDGTNNYLVGESRAGNNSRYFHVLNLTSMMGFHLLRLLYLHGSREFAAVYMQDEYVSPELPRTGWQRATERLAEFSWEARSKSNCSTVRRSRVLFLLQARPRKVGAREELIIRYEPSWGERVVSVTKNETRRESEVKETGKKKRTERNEKGEEGEEVERKEWKRALDIVVVALLDADLFYFVFLQIPRIHAAKFQLLRQKRT